jgi:hypothetical protein
MHTTLSRYGKYRAYRRIHSLRGYKYAFIKKQHDHRLTQVILNVYISNQRENGGV